MILILAYLGISSTVAGGKNFHSSLSSADYQEGPAHGFVSVKTKSAM